MQEMQEKIAVLSEIISPLQKLPWMTDAQYLENIKAHGYIIEQSDKEMHIYKPK